MWRVWVGLNATHSFGLILFGALYGYLAMGHREFLFRSCFLLALGFALLLGYAVIARLYLFHCAVSRNRVGGGSLPSRNRRQSGTVEAQITCRNPI